jgi:ArsR family transcriptional regulator
MLTINMDMPYLLDILGNENRRNILTLLSYRPCYVTEISEELHVAPKAIIDHLKILEAAGLVESYHDEQGRKYYEIANNVRIEVSISPLMFEVNVSRLEADPEDRKSLMERYDIDEEATKALRHMSDELQRLNRSAIELREAQKSVQGTISEVTGMCIELINRVAADQIEAEILYLLIRGPTSYEELTGKLNIPGEVMRGELAKLLKKELVTYKRGFWSIK